jgi:DNA primase catalytic core
MRISEQISHIANSADIIEIAKAYGLKPDEENRMVCLEDHGKGTKTLHFDIDTQTYYCVDPQCRTHGNVVDLVHSLEGHSIRHAASSVAIRMGMGAIENDEGLEEYEQVRACLRAAARIYARNLDHAMPYLEGRGISRPTSERYLIGMTRGKDDLRKALAKEGFKKKLIDAAGLLNRSGQDFFRDKVIVPLRVSGQVVGFYGRAVKEDDEIRHLRMSNDRVIIGEGPFNWNPRREEIIAVEGIFDALALIDKGFTKAVATLGTQGLSTEQNRKLLQKSQVRRVYVCFDGDTAGEKSAAKSAFGIEDMGKEVRIVDLGEEDPNEFLLSHSPDDFQDRLRKGVPPVQFEINHVDENLELEEKIAALENVFRRVRDMLPLEREAVVKRLAGKMGVAKKVVEDHVASVAALEDATLQYLDVTDKRMIHPALDMADETLLMTVPQASTNPETGAIEWKPFIVTSDREFFPLDSTELLKRGYMTTVEGMGDAPRYSGHVIKGFLTGTRKGEIVPTFRRIHYLLTRNVDFPDENAHAFLTCWIIGTYFHPMFNYYPYIHFTGTKNVGKSKTMKLMSCICFNGVMSVSITPASQFRIIEAFRPTLFMDETEDLKEKGFSDKRALLLGGYEAGSSVLRCEKEKDNYTVKRMANYGPRAFASIEGLEDTLASRTVQITMQRSFNPEIKEKEVTLNNPEFQEIRDALFLLAMSYAPTVKELYEEVTRPQTVEFGDREFNLFKPILAIGRAASDMEGLEEQLIAFQNTAYRNKVAEYNRSAPENVLLQFLMDTVTEDGLFRSDELHTRFVNHLKNNGIDLSVMVTKPFMGTLIKKLGIVSDSRRSPDRTCTLYHLKVEVLKRVAENYQVT